MRYLLTILISLLPVPALAEPRNFAELLDIFVRILGYVLVLLYALGFLVFFWGVAVFIWNRDDEGAREDGKRKMFWGIVAFVAGFSVWGLAGILSGTFDLGPVAIPQLPEG